VTRWSLSLQGRFRFRRFVGVDVFFCNLWLSHDFHYHGRLAKGRFSIWDFYYDRAKRIVPGLLGMCLSCSRPATFAGTRSPIITLVLHRLPRSSSFRISGSGKATGYSMRKATPNGSCILGAFRWNGSSIWLSGPSHGTLQVERTRRSIVRFLGLLQFCPFYCAFGFPKMIRLPYSICTQRVSAFYLLPQRAWELLRAGSSPCNSGIVSKIIPAFFLPVAFCS